MVVQLQQILFDLEPPPRLRLLGRYRVISEDIPPRRRLLLNRQFLLARLRRAFLQDSPTPGGSLRFAHRGLSSFTPPACKTRSPKGLRGH